MNLHLKFRSKAFRFFHEAFAFETFGKSMGRAAQVAAVEFKNLSPKEQNLGIDWLWELISQNPQKYYDSSYLKVIAYAKDRRFLPFLEAYSKRLEKQNHQFVTNWIDKDENRSITVRTDYDEDLKICREAIQELKKHPET